MLSRLVTVALAWSALLLIAPHDLAHAQALPERDAQLEELKRIYAEGKARAKRPYMGQEDIHGREAWFNFMRSYPYAQVPADARRTAIRAMKQIEETIARSRAANGKGSRLMASTMWEPIGPTNQGGRVRGLAIHPSRAGTFLVGAAAGGVWRTTNGGDSWTPTMDGEEAISVCALAYDYSNPNIVYAGTGENFPSSQSLLVNTPSYLGNGVYKSTDEGLTWTHAGLSIAGAVSKIAVHRQQPSIVYAAVAKQSGGFYRSTDGGTTWSQTANGDIYDLAVNPQNSNEVYIAFSNSVRRSTDGGLTFTTTTSGMSTGGGVRFSIAIAASQPSRLYVLAARNAGSGGEIGEVYVSTNRGDSWQLKRTFSESFFNDQGIYDNFIAVNPSDPNIVLAGGIDVYRTSDGGSSWINTTQVYSGGDVHPDQHVAEFDPTSHSVVVLGNDGGVYASVDAGLDWTRLSNGLAITQFYRMEVDQSRPFRVYGGTQDNGTSGSFGTTGFTENWTQVLGGDGFFCVTDQADPNFFYAELYYGTLFRISATNPSQRSRIDGGISDNDEGNWATPIAMSPADKKSLYSGRTNLWRTTDRGGRWTSIAVGMTSKIASIGLSPSDAQDIVVGSLNGVMRASTDYGVTWTPARGSLPGSVVTDIRFDPVAPNRVYATYSGSGPSHVFRSDNNGVDWVNITSNLPATPANAIEIDPTNTARLFVATDVGVFFSPNGGDFWLPFNAGLPLAPASDLRIHRTSRSLVAATHGRSMFRVSIDDLQIDPTLVTPIGGERIATPGPLTIQWFGFSGPVTVSIKYSADEPYQVLASGVTDDRITVELPMRMSTTARVRVEETGTGRVVTSGFLTLVTPSNVTALGRRGFIAEAIELRGSTLWATARGSDSIYRLRLPLLTGASAIVRSGFGGTIRDLAHDPARDEFLALVTEPDFTAPRIYRMDTTGRSLGAITIPAEIVAASGIAIRGEVLAVTTPAPDPTLWLLDVATGTELLRSTIAEAEGIERDGLVWNGRAYVQGVALDSGDAVFATELQQFSGSDPIRVFERIPVILPTGGRLDFFGLAHVPSLAGVEYYFATDTSGTFYRFRADVLSSAGVDLLTGAARSLGSVGVRPNPARADVVLALGLVRSTDIGVSVVDPSGRVLLRMPASRLGVGDHDLRLDVSTLAAGLYYVVVETGAERLVRPLTVVR